MSPTGIEPIDDNSHLIDILRDILGVIPGNILGSILGQVRHVHWLHLARWVEKGNGVKAIVVNGH